LTPPRLSGGAAPVRDAGQGRGQGGAKGVRQHHRVGEGMGAQPPDGVREVAEPGGKGNQSVGIRVQLPQAPLSGA